MNGPTPKTWTRSISVAVKTPSGRTEESLELNVAALELYEELREHSLTHALAIVSAAQTALAVPLPSHTGMHIVVLLVAQVIPIEEIERHQRQAQLSVVPTGPRRAS